MYKHIIFDFDGVISNSREIACQEINRLREQRFPQIPTVQNQNNLSELYCGPLKTSLKRYGLSDKDVGLFFDLHSAAMQQRACEILPFRDVLRVIARIDDFGCSIVTSSYTPAVLEILARSPYYDRRKFRRISGRELKLPKSQRICALLNELCLRPAEVLHVGDMVSDLLYSREAGVPFCAVGWGYHPICYLRAFGPDHEAEHPSLLLDTVRSESNVMSF